MESECHPLVVSGQDIKIKFLEKDPRFYLNKSTILFGASNSGKSTILMEILYLLKNTVPNIFVFAPTAESNNAFDDIVPSPMIYKEVEIAVLQEIYNRQQAATKIYNTVNNMSGLKKLFELIADEKTIAIANAVYRNAHNIIEKKKNDSTVSFLEQRAAAFSIKEARDEYLKKLYKDTIRSTNPFKLQQLRLLENDHYIIKYLDFNPNCVVVFDDCGAVLKKFQKEEVVKKIIFQGRHSFINIILTLQDDVSLESSIKKNSFVNIFTTSRCALAYFERGSNNFSKKEKEKAAKIINYIFDNSSKKDYKKLVYLRDEVDPFRYTIADTYDVFRFGSPSLWKLCERLEKDKKECDFSNDPTLSAFKITGRSTSNSSSSRNGKKRRK